MVNGQWSLIIGPHRQQLVHTGSSRFFKSLFFRFDQRKNDRW